MKLRLALSLAILTAAGWTQTPIPAATVTGVVVGPGYIKSANRQIVRTNANVVYLDMVDDSNCLKTSGPTSAVIKMMKGSGAQAGNAQVPTTFTEVDAAHHPVATSSGDCTFTGGVANTINTPEIRLDPTTGLIHTVYIKATSATTGSLIYQAFDTTTDTWNTPSTIATGATTCGGGGWPRWGNAALTLDNSNIPYVVFATAAACNPSFTNQLNWLAKTGGGGTWSAPTVISGSSGTEELYPTMVTAGDGSIHLAWVDNSVTAAHANVKYAHFSGGSWGAIETAAASTLSADDDDGTVNIAIDLSGLPHIAYMVGTGQNGVPCTSGCDNFVRERYRSAAGTWLDNSPPATAGGNPSATGTWPTGGVGHSPSIYISSLGTVFDFLGHDTNKTPGPFEYQLNLGGAFTAQQNIDPCNATTSPGGEAGCDGAISIRYDPQRDVNPGLIDVAYYKEDDGTSGFNHHGTTWFKSISIPTQVVNPILPPGNYSGSGPGTANLWVGAGGTCSRSGSAVAYNAATSCVSFAAAESAAQSGDVIVVLNGNYGSQSISGAAKTTTWYAQTYGSAIVNTLAVTAGGTTIHGVYVANTQTITQDSVHDLTVNSATSNVSFPIVIDDTNPRRLNITSSAYVTISHSDMGHYDTFTCAAECDAVTLGSAPIDHITFLNNLFHDAYDVTTNGQKDQAQHNDMVSFLFTVGGSNITFDGNKFWYWGGGGSAIQSSAQGSGALNNWTIQNNTFGTYNAPALSGLTPGGNTMTYGQGNCTGFLIIRNNVYASGKSMANTGGCTISSADVSGNISLNNFFDTCITSGTGTPTGGHNVFVSSSANNNCGSNNKICTPTWLNGTPAIGNTFDSRLSAGDTCAKTSGNPASFPPTDQYGSTRSSPPDAGAYALTGGSGCTTLPTGSITSPPAGTLLGSINIQATAAATCGSVASVQYLLDGANLASATTAPYTVTWTTTTYSNGAHTLNCKITDTFANVGTCPNVNVTLNNNIVAQPTGLFISQISRVYQ